MVIKEFPPHDVADEHGLLAVGGDLDVESLLLAYREGVFPWPIHDEYLTWFSPPIRAVLPVDNFIVSKSFKKFLKKHSYSIVMNRNFEEVVSRCQNSPNRKEQQGTWITSEISNGYLDLHRAGFAHSVEAYREDLLVGGLYGVCIGGMFAGESMFYEEPNTSKICLKYLVERVREGGGTVVDCQVLTPLTESLGAIEMPRDRFLEILKKEIQKPSIF